MTVDVRLHQEDTGFCNGSNGIGGEGIDVTLSSLVVVGRR